MTLRHVVVTAVVLSLAGALGCQSPSHAGSVSGADTPGAGDGTSGSAGNGGTTGGAGTPPSAAAAASGLSGGSAIVFDDWLRAVRVDLGTMTKVEWTIAWDSDDTLGFGGGVFTDVESFGLGDDLPYNYPVHFLKTAPGSVQPGDVFTTPPVHGLIQSGVNPSPDGKSFVMWTKEDAELGDPEISYVTIFDANAKVLFRIQDYAWPVWLAPDQLIVAGNDGLFTVKTDGHPPVRVGTWKLGNADAPLGRVVVSPDGKSFAFTQNDTIWRAELAGGAPVQLTAQKIGVASPAWSPNGTQLLVRSDDCYPLGSASPTPALVVISSSAPNQDVGKAQQVMLADKTPVRSCGPFYWLP
jgi:hypothetical protein